MLVIGGGSLSADFVLATTDRAACLKPVQRPPRLEAPGITANVVGRRMGSEASTWQVDSPGYRDLKTNRRFPGMTGRALCEYSVAKRWMSEAATSSGNSVSIQSTFSVQGGVVREPEKV